MSESFRLLLQDGEGRIESRNVGVKPKWTVKELKLAIQDKFSIPYCCQKLYFETLQLKNSDRITDYRFRESDVIHVKYETTADIDEVLNAINSLKQLVATLAEAERTPDVVKFNIALVSSLPNKVVTLNQLGERHFSKLSSNKCYANMAFFMSHEGIDMLLKAHQLLLKHDEPPVLLLEAVFVLLWARLSLMRNCLETNHLRDITSLVLGSFQRHDIKKALDSSPINNGLRIKMDVIQLSLRAISK